MAKWGVLVVGVDGCRDGWITVLWRDGDVTVRFMATIEELDEFVDADAVAIDMPIGLSTSGDRRADVLARQELRGRASTIFNAPARACLTAVDDYSSANEISRREGAKGLSRQSFGLLKKIREVDDYGRVARMPLFEVHPELSFARLNAGVVLPSKKSWAGVIARRQLLAREGIHLDDFHGRGAERAAPDDVLDAGVCAWTAQRIVHGDVRRLPDPPEVDATGREMCIRV